MKAASEKPKRPRTSQKSVKKKNSGQDKFLADHLYFFHEGHDCHAYEFLGARPETRDGVGGYVFRVWAPDAESVGVIGDFNGWNRSEHEMTKISVGVWERWIPGVAEYSAYKYAVKARDGRILEKADPYAYHAETRPHTASKAVDISGYEWGDADWIASRHDYYNKPLNIYELHLGSWQRYEDGNTLSYRETAHRLCEYIVEMGYTHVELLPVMEHPYDGSWGYQVTGYFAPTSRFGTPHDFMYLVDTLHRHGIGVLLDWVPAHFPKDGHGLIEFDGTCCYEYSDPYRREHPQWGTRVFDFGRNETRAFLISSAVFWLDKYHIDGLRVDAVASMLYHDFGRDGGWRPNIHGGNENIEAISFLRELNERVYEQFPYALMMAEESTSWPLVSKPVYMGGLGFNFKWNMGWMNDTLAYMKQDPIFRRYHHNKLTFPMMYQFSENFILPLSHDEVVHLKGSLISKMPGYYKDKFAGLRAYLSFMTAHPGKKLLFMGGEFGHFAEWDEKKSIDWHLLDYPMHAQLHEYVKVLNRFYLDNPAFWENDDNWDGFVWLATGDAPGNTIAFTRVDRSGKEIIAAFNFSLLSRPGYRLGVRRPGVYREILSSDEPRFGGEGRLNTNDLSTGSVYCGGHAQSILLTLPPFSAVFLERLSESES